MKRILSVMAAALAMGFAGNAYAFHDGGVAYCDGCHVMHNAAGGTAKSTYAGNSTWGGTQSAYAPWTTQTNRYLLQGSDQSSTCLSCHAQSPGSGYHIADMNTANWVNGPRNFTPGGDFGYLKRTYSWTASYGAAGKSIGNRHGHNIVAQDFGLVADTLLTAPGGSITFTATGTSVFSCSSCHDPHGRYRIVSDTGGTVTWAGPSAVGSKILPIGQSGSYGGLPTSTEAVGAYRLLAGVGYVTKSNPSAPAFASMPPVAVAPSTYNQRENGGEVRVAYGQGMGEWCANCHTNIHMDTYTSGTPGLIHPAGNGAAMTAVFAVYNAYKSSGDLSGSNQYTSLVPFEQHTGDLAVLAANASNTAAFGSSGPAASATTNVMCLSCHRAHASAFDSITRWTNTSEFLTFDTLPGSDATGEASYGQYAQGKTMAENESAYYGRNTTNGGFGDFQRSMCNKCHGKD